jgi:hypothetical protein
LPSLHIYAKEANFLYVLAFNISTAGRKEGALTTIKESSFPQIWKRSDCKKPNTGEEKQR